jgi:cardiolipin synthase
MTMYELNDTSAEADLAGAAARGVDVRVILDQHLEKERNTAAFAYLAARGVHVVWGPAGTTYHQKTLTVDGATSAVMTLNLVSRDYPLTRDFALIDTIPADVAAVRTTFAADFAGQPIRPPDGTDLVWSPTNATTSILATIDGAGRNLAIENEEMSDAAVVDALTAAAKRGVDVEITMTSDRAYESAFTKLANAGAHVHLYADTAGSLSIHAKTIVADAGLPDQRVLVGSENFSTASLDYNRELGILTADPAVVAGVAATLASDYAGGTAYP